MFSDLTFDSQRHLYHWKGKIVPLSVSGLVERHVHKFDPHKIVYGGKSIVELSAAKASRNEGREISVHELQHSWQTINKNACELGTEIHAFMEEYTGLQTPKLPQERAGIQYIKDVSREYIISFRELRAYSREFNYAGTMDIPLKYKNKDVFVIDDYKTNKDLFKSYDNLKPPFDHLEATPYNKYQLQLSYYQIMLEEIGLEIENRRLVYLKADGTYRIFPLFDFTDDLRYYLKTHKVE